MLNLEELLNSNSFLYIENFEPKNGIWKNL